MHGIDAHCSERPEGHFQNLEIPDSMLRISLAMSALESRTDMPFRVIPLLTRMYGPAVRCKWILPSWR
jgi:hypothetical protein